MTETTKTSLSPEDEAKLQKAIDGINQVLKDTGTNLQPYIDRQLGADVAMIRVILAPKTLDAVASTPTQPSTEAKTV